MTTLSLSRGLSLLPEDDLLDGLGCHVATEAAPGLSKGWLALLPSDGPRRLLEPSRLSYVPSEGRRLRVYAGLAPGTYEAHSVLTLHPGRAHRTVFAVEHGGFRVISPREGAPVQLALWDPNRAEAEQEEGRDAG